MGSFGGKKSSRPVVVEDLKTVLHEYIPEMQLH